MGLGDDIKNTADQVGGKAKEEWGDLTDNEKLEAEGKADQAAAKARKAADDLKEGVSDAAENAKDAWNDATR